MLSPIPSEDSSLWHVPFLRGVGIGDYKSIEKTSVLLRSLTVLVERNGSGKSNFVDALRFIADSLQTSIDHAIRSRGVLYGISRRGVDPPNFLISPYIGLSDEREAEYVVLVDISPSGEFEVLTEALA